MARTITGQSARHLAPAGRVITRAQAAPDARAGEVDASLEQLSHWMDRVFRIPGLGVRFGLDSLVGLIPGVGDTATALVSLYILTAAARHGVSRLTILRMALNVGIDYVVGSIPVIGDLFDVWWKANHRNVELLRSRMSASGPAAARGRRADMAFVTTVIVGLVLLLIGAIALSLYLFAQLGRLVNLW